MSDAHVNEDLAHPRYRTPNPDFATRVRESFARQAFMATLGA